MFRGIQRKVNRLKGDIYTTPRVAKLPRTIKLIQKKIHTSLVVLLKGTYYSCTFYYVKI